MRYLSVLYLLILGSVISRAADVVTTQNIHTMYTNGTLTTESPYTVGVTDFVTYTCSGTNAKIWMYDAQTRVCIFLPNNGSKVQTSLISNFKHLEFYYYPVDKNYLSPTCTMVISISEDGSSWTNITASATGINGAVNVDIPTPGDYYLKIQNTNTSKPFYISQIQYTTESCNCFRVR